MYRRPLFGKNVLQQHARTSIQDMFQSDIGSKRAIDNNNHSDSQSNSLATDATLASADWQQVPTNRAHMMLANFNWALAAIDAKIPCENSSGSAKTLDWASVGTADTIGRRREMEDVVIVESTTLYNTGGSTTSSSLYSRAGLHQSRHENMYDRDATIHRVWLCAVLDGHGGGEASAFVGSRWPAMLFDMLSLVREPMTAEKIRHAAQSSLRQCNVALERALLGAPDVGTTLCAVLIIDGRTLYCINVGDSRCVAVRASDGAYKALSRDHKPSRTDELQRITRLGGSVVMCDGVARVGGNLSLSRALGDFGSAPYIIGEAEISGPHSTAEIGAVALMCDGVTDVLEDSQTAALIGALVPLKGAECAAAALRDAAYVFGSSDNISAVVLNLAASPPSSSSLQ